MPGIRGNGSTFDGTAGGNMAYAELSTDFSTTDSTVPGADVVSAILTTAGNTRIKITFHAEGVNNTSNGGIFFEFYLDGVQLNGEALARAVSAGAVCEANYVKITGIVAAGAHTVAVKARVSSGTTGTINAATTPLIYCAHLVLEEVDI